MFNIDQFNKTIARHLTLAIGTMWCVYLFMGLTIIPFLIPNVTPLIQYVSSSFLQLIFLPLIMVGSAVLNEKLEKRAEQDHKTLMRQFGQLEDLLKTQAKEVKELKNIHSDIHTLLKKETGSKTKKKSAA